MTQLLRPGKHDVEIEIEIEIDTVVEWMSSLVSESH